jgi:hypothetical protein
MQVSVLLMNGDKIQRTINYLPSGRGFYNVVAKGYQMAKCSTPEAALEAAKKFEELGVEHCYIKVPSGLTEVALDSLRIA